MVVHSLGAVMVYDLFYTTFHSSHFYSELYFRVTDHDKELL